MFYYDAIRKLQILEETLVKTKTAALFPTGLSIINLASSDAEEMREQSVFWSFEHKQFSRGAFEGKINSFHTSRLQLSLAHRSVGIIARGGLPAKTTIISFPITPPKSLHYRGQLMKAYQVIALKHTEELELHTSLPTTMLTIAVSTALLEEQARAVNGNSFDSLRCQERINIHPKEYRKRTDHLVLLLKTLQGSNRTRNGDEEELLEKEILETFLLGAIWKRDRFLVIMNLILLSFSGRGVMLAMILSIAFFVYLKVNEGDLIENFIEESKEWWKKNNAFRFPKYLI